MEMSEVVRLISKVDQVNDPLQFPAVHKNLRKTRNPRQNVSRGDYLTIFTEPEGNNCFSIISELNKRE